MRPIGIQSIFLNSSNLVMMKLYELNLSNGRLTISDSDAISRQKGIISKRKLYFKRRINISLNVASMGSKAVTI